MPKKRFKAALLLVGEINMRMPKQYNYEVDETINKFSAFDVK